MLANRTIHPAPAAPVIPVTAPAEGVRKAVLVLGAAVGMSAGFSSLYFSTMGIFLKPIASAFGWGRGQLSGVALLAMLASAIAAPLVGKLIARHGATRTIGVSIALFAAGLFGMSQLPASLPLLGALSFFLGAVGTATTAIGYLSTFPQHFERRLGLALGCAMIGVGVGAALAPVLAQSLVTAYGWRAAYQWLAGGALALGLLALGAAARFGPPGAGAGTRTGTSADTSAGAGAVRALEGDTTAEAVRSARFWIMFAALGLVAIAGLGAAVHLSAILTDHGVAPASAAGVASLLGAAVAFGRFGSGALLDHLPARYIAAASFALAAVGLLLVGTVPSGGVLTTQACGAALIGLVLGAEGDLIPFLVRRYFGRKAFSTLYGCVCSVYMLGGVLGPVIYGAGFDRIGSYLPVLQAAAAGCLLSALLVLCLGPYRHHNKTLETQ